jgi:hypothetical protein
MADGETTRQRTANDGRRILTMDDGRWRMKGHNYNNTTIKQCMETEEEDGGSDERQRIPQLIRRDYDWGKEEGLHLPLNQKGGCHDGHGDGQQQPRTQQSAHK